jgi:hypothetical protein
MSAARVVSAVLMVWIALSARPVDACTMRAPGLFRVFHEGLVIPGNLVYFKVNERFPDPGPAHLFDSRGDEVAARIRQIGPDRVFAPDEPLAVGGYAFTYEEYGKEARFLFEVGPAVKVALAPARLALASHAHELAGTDSERERYSFSFSDDDPADALQHLMERSVTLDGKKLSFHGTRSGELEVHTYCRNPEYQYDTCGWLMNVPTGEHELAVTTSIVGYGTTEPVRARVQTTCNPAAERSVFIMPAPPPRSVTSLFEVPPRTGGCSLQSWTGNSATMVAAFAVACLGIRRLGREG